MQLNNEQEFIVNQFIKGESFLINAVAGSGKSTLLRYLCHTEYAKSKKILLVAFNKHIADEMKFTVPKNVTVSTLHSLGLRLLSNLEGSYKLSSIGTHDLYKKLKLKRDNIMRYGDFEQYWQIVRLMCPTWLHSSLWVEKTKQLVELWAQQNIDLSWVEKAFELHNNTRKETGSIDFTDMLWLPSIDKKVKAGVYDCILIDECQDLNNAQLALIRKISLPTTQIIAVGDPMQSIFGFSGAGIDNYPLIKKLFNIEAVYNSSYCYRCPSSHLDLARSYNPIIRNVKSDLGLIDHREKLDITTVPSHSLIIAPTYKLLIDTLLDALDKEIPVQLKGVNCFSGILDSIKTKGYSQGLDDIIEKTKNKIEYTPRLPSTKDILRDLEIKLEIIEEIICLNKGQETLKRFLYQIQNRSLDSRIIVSTIHRAKGLEAPFVALFTDDKYQKPSSEEDLKLNYVAVTRSQQELVIIG